MHRLHAKKCTVHFLQVSFKPHNLSAGTTSLLLQIRKHILKVKKKVEVTNSQWENQNLKGLCTPLKPTLSPCFCIAIYLFEKVFSPKTLSSWWQKPAIHHFNQFPNIVPDIWETGMKQINEADNELCKLALQMLNMSILGNTRR